MEVLTGAIEDQKKYLFQAQEEHAHCLQVSRGFSLVHFLVAERRKIRLIESNAKWRYKKFKI
jgi:hypothetical protein